MSLTSYLPSPRRARPGIAVGSIALAVLAVLGTTPVDRIGTPRPDPVVISAEGGVTFADLFEQMRDPETSGEGRSAVAVASTPPQAPAPDGAPPAPAPPPVAPEVVPVRPALLVRGADTAAVAQMGAVPGVAAVAGAVTGEVTVEAPGGPQVISVAAVDPVAFRPLTPEVTAAEVGVWERIAAGDAVFTHDAGNRLAVPLGSTVTAGAGSVADAAPAVPDLAGTVPATADGGAPLRIGALASNGIPPVADALVSMDTGAALGLTGTGDVYVGLADGADVEAVRRALEPLGEVEEIRPPETQTNTFGAFLVGAEARSFFEPFDYIDHGDGLITIEEGWVRRNIASTTQIPLLNGTVTCHRQMLKQLYAAMSEVEAAGLGPMIDPSQYGGCWVARHIDFNPSKPISMHGWGLAVDLNVSTNQLGARPTMDPRIVEIFDRWGFVWGGRWSRPDGMHFEIGAVVDVAVPDGFFR